MDKHDPMHAEHESSREESTRNSRIMCFCPQGVGSVTECFSKIVLRAQWRPQTLKSLAYFIITESVSWSVQRWNLGSAHCWWAAVFWWEWRAFPHPTAQGCRGKLSSEGRYMPLEIKPTIECTVLGWTGVLTQQNRLHSEYPPTQREVNKTVI